MISNDCAAFILNVCKYVLNSPESADEMMELFYDIHGIDIEDAIDEVLKGMKMPNIHLSDDAAYHQRRFAAFVNTEEE